MCRRSEPTMSDICEALLSTLLALIPTIGMTALMLASAHRRGHARIPAALGRVIARTVRIWAWLPALSLAGLAVLFTVVWIQNGERPTPGYYHSLFDRWIGGPDPRMYDPVRWILLVGLATGLLSIALVPGLFAIARSVGSPLALRSRTAFYAGWALSLALILADPFEMFGWLTSHL